MKHIGALLFLYAESPLHAGSGTGIGAVDLPIQRERMSNLPMVQGSGIKGALRADMDTGNDDTEVLALFGPRPPNKGGGDAANEYAGAIAVGDSSLLLFPVRTVWGGWAWLTAPMVLQRLARDLEILGADNGVIAAAACALDSDTPAPSAGGDDPDDRVLVTEHSDVCRDNNLLIEDFAYVSKPSPAVADLATWLQSNAMPDTQGYQPFAERLSRQLVVVSDAELRFWAEHATEVVTRTRIDPELGTVAKGALWTEECLPAETLLWSRVLFQDSHRCGKTGKTTIARTDLHKTFVKHAAARSRLHLGGDHTVGRGLVGLRVYPALADNKEIAS